MKSSRSNYQSNKIVTVFMLFILVSFSYLSTCDAQTQLYLNKVSNVTGFGIGYSITIQNSSAYITGNEGFVIIDISNPQKPKKIGEYLSEGNGFGIHVEADIAYFINGGYGLEIVNISNPVNPFLIGSCYIEGISNTVYTEGNYAYVTNYDTGLHIIDITDFSNPIRVGGYSVYGRADKVVVSNEIAYVAFPNTGVVVLNVTFPSSPIYLDSISSTGGAKGLDIHNNFLFVSCYSSNVVVVDISYPEYTIVLGIHSDDDGGEAQGVEGNSTHLYIADNFGVEYLDISSLPTIVKKAEYRRSISSAHDVEFMENYVFTAGGGLGKTCIVFEVSDTKKLEFLWIYISFPVAIALIVIGILIYRMKIRRDKV